jgi:DNA-binding beta-propeller fold protein YncE
MRTAGLCAPGLTVALTFLGGAGCSSSIGDSRSGAASGPAPAPTAAAAAEAPPPPDSLAPLYALTPRAEYARLAPPVGGVPVALRDQDFVAADVRVSAADRLDAIAEQLALERGEDAPPDLIPALDDRLRARGIPFRGNPSDVLLASQPDGARLFVPLGGDLMTPGNEVAVLDVGGAPALLGRVRVGVRPQRLALHPAGLVIVCNQYSNYLSVLDARSGAALERDGQPLRIYTEPHCADLVLVARDAARPDPDAQYLYVANRWRRSVLVYRLDVQRGPGGGVAQVLQTDATGAALYSGPLREIVDVGPAPSRLRLDPVGRALYVSNHQGGLVARIDLDSQTVTARFEAGAPSADVAPLADRVYVATLMPDRGLLAPQDANVSPSVQAAPLEVVGLDGAVHRAHPGALLDGTRSYGFEDVRNGLWELDLALRPLAYYTDDVSAEPGFAPARKILAGALPQALVRNAAGDRLYLALGGSDLVQELIVDPAAASSAPSPGRTFATRERPFALALDEARARLYVAAWGGEVLEVIDLAGGARLAEVDLGYAQPRYPATALEEGERRFYDASWSNNGRKSCAHCHFDELIGDGLAFANGTTAPTAVHRVKPNQNLLTTDAYFWNGSFAHGGYRSLAFAAQLRTNCEIVMFGLVEGPASDPATRVGDPANVTSDGRDAACRPLDSAPGALPANFDEGDPSIREVVAAQQALGDAHVIATTGRSSDELSRLIDLYSVSELRLPPNPARQGLERGAASPQEREALERGEALFARAGCAGCHVPADPRQPFANGAERGSGADWTARFADRYADDPRLLALLPEGLPAAFLDAIRTETPSPDVNVHLDPIDFLTPFCFAPGSCLVFEDPLEPGIGEAEEMRRLELLVRVHLADRARGFVPGNVRGQVKINVPALRGVWAQAGLLHHGHARGIREAVLAPGHPALRPGERGWAVSAAGEPDTHGLTHDLTAGEVDALVRYVRSIE